MNRPAHLAFDNCQDQDWQDFLDGKLSRLYVVRDEGSSCPERDVWTLSPIPSHTGWCTDAGCPGYGLPLEVATLIANAWNALADTKHPSTMPRVRTETGLEAPEIPEP